MNRSQKKDVVVFLKETFSKSSFFVLVSFHGLTVSGALDLRRNLCGMNGGMRVVKNTLLEKAFCATEGEALLQFIQGSTAVVWGDDALGISKVLVDFSKKFKSSLSCRAGFLDGSCVSGERVEFLAGLPSLDVLRSKILGVISQSFGSLVRVLGAYVDKNEG